MKATLFLVIVSVSVAVIYSESCRDDSDCTHVTCDSSSRLACSHGLCTCLVAANAGSCFSATCTARADCDSCQCRDSHAERHCFDGHCLCGHGFGPGVVEAIPHEMLPLGPSAARQAEKLANNQPAVTKFQTRHTPILEFDNNVAHSNRERGLMFDNRISNGHKRGKTFVPENARFGNLSLDSKKDNTWPKSNGNEF